MWRDGSALEVRRGDPVGNARRAAAHTRQEYLGWLRQYPDRRLFMQPVYLDKGRSSDGDGVLRDWWTAADAERFTRVAQRLSDQVGSYEPIPGKKVNGALTLGESIADVAGLVVAHDAYRRSLGGKPAPVLDGYTADQRFFLAYAQAWRWKGPCAPTPCGTSTPGTRPSTCDRGRSCTWRRRNASGRPESTRRAGRCSRGSGWTLDTPPYN